MYEKDPELKEKLKNTKGFCLDHLKVVLEGADTYLKGDKRKEFYDIVLPHHMFSKNKITRYSAGHLMAVQNTG